MNVRFNYFTGHFRDVISSLRRALSQYVRNAWRFKVGATTDPWSRAEQHAKSDSTWRELVVMYKTTSFQYVIDVERELIRHGWRSHLLPFSENRAPGGEGIRPGAGSYYVYVLLA